MCLNIYNVFWVLYSALQTKTCEAVNAPEKRVEPLLYFLKKPQVLLNECLFKFWGLNVECECMCVSTDAYSLVWLEYLESAFSNCSAEYE